MKTLLLLLSALLLTPLSLLAQTTAIPTITITTPATNTYKDLIIIGTATATVGTNGTGGIKEVWYQTQGSQKWRKAQLTAKGRTPTTWIVNFKNTSSVGKRVIFYAVDTSGRKSDVVGRHFKRGTGTSPTSDDDDEDVITP